jgi:hypothetical protein
MLISCPTPSRWSAVHRFRRAPSAHPLPRSASSRLVAWLLGAGALALACGPHVASRDSDANATETMRGGEADTGSSPLATSLNVSVNEGVVLTLHVTNTSDKRLEITFPSGQTHDFAVLDSAGKVVWQWSEDRLFTQAIQNKLLTPRESAKFEERWNASGLTGKFVAVATLRSTNYPVEERIEFTLP